MHINHIRGIQIHKMNLIAWMFLMLILEIIIAAIIYASIV